MCKRQLRGYQACEDRWKIVAWLVKLVPALQQLSEQAVLQLSLAAAAVAAAAAATTTARTEVQLMRYVHDLAAAVVAAA